jgi:phosphopantothenoylcysteine synthetase/decarboxylase
MTFAPERELIITGGPTWEPIDSVRRLTNHSTGALATFLAEQFQANGFRVQFFRSDACVVPAPQVPIIPFTTSQSLQSALQEHSNAHPLAVLHLAAVSDFQVAAIEGSSQGEGKLSSRDGELILRLRPAPKILSMLRGWMPDSFLVGWKFEVDEDRAAALRKGFRQIKESVTDACVVNGPAYGEGFGYCSLPDFHEHLSDRHGLFEKLAQQIISPPRTATHA